jgi:hypothetical protein
MTSRTSHPHNPKKEAPTMAFISSGGPAVRIPSAHLGRDLVKGTERVGERVAGIPPKTLVAYAALAVMAVLVTALALLLGGGPDALKASALGGDAIGGLDGWITGITSNLKWIAGAMAAAGVVFIAILFLIGHSRAQDYALRFGIGCAILAGGTGIIA